MSRLPEKMKLLSVALSLILMSRGWADIVVQGDVGSIPNGFAVGRYADGTLTVNGGSQITLAQNVLVGVGHHLNPDGNSWGYYHPLGTLNIDGDGSLVHGGSMYVGDATGVGIVNMTNGGKVHMEFYEVKVAQGSELNMEVTGDDMIFIGPNISNASGFANNGTVTFTARGGLAPGEYKPIVLGYGDTSWPGWSGDGTYQAFGGVWDNTDHTFTVGAPVTTTEGTPVTFDPSQTQRVLVSPSDQYARHLVVQFKAYDDLTDFTFSASRSDADKITALINLAGDDQKLLTSWDLESPSLPEDDLVALAMEIGQGYDSDTMQVWHYDDAMGWNLYDPMNLTYNGGRISFLVEGFSSYAITAPMDGAVVPLPSGIVLGICGLAMAMKRLRSHC